MVGAPIVTPDVEAVVLDGLAANPTAPAAAAPATANPIQSHL